MALVLTLGSNSHKVFIGKEEEIVIELIQVKKKQIRLAFHTKDRSVYIGRQTYSEALEKKKVKEDGKD